MKLTIIRIEMSAAKSIESIVYFLASILTQSLFKIEMEVLSWNQRKEDLFHLRHSKKFFFFFFSFFLFCWLDLNDVKSKSFFHRNDDFLLKTEDKKHSNYCDKISVYGEQHPKAGQNIKPIDEVNKVKCKM